MSLRSSIARLRPPARLGTALLVQLPSFPASSSSQAGPSRPPRRYASSQSKNPLPEFQGDFASIRKLFDPPSPPPPSPSFLPSDSIEPILPHTRPIGEVDLDIASYRPPGYMPRALPPDTDPMLDLFVNMIMRQGRKALVQRKVADMLDLIHRATNQNPVDLFHRAILLVSPSAKIVTMKKANKSIPVPTPLHERQRYHQGIAWILSAADKQRKRLPMERRLAREILLILEGTSEVYQRLDERHKQATMNRSQVITHARGR